MFICIKKSIAEKQQKEVGFFQNQDLPFTLRSYQFWKTTF